MWPENTRRNNQTAKRLLEDGYVIVKQSDIPSDVRPYGWKPDAEPIQLSPGAPGDVLVRVDNNQYAGFNTWSPAQAGSFEDAPNDDVAYVRYNGQWVPLANFLGS